MASKGVTLIYNWLLFPVIAGFLLVLSLSAFLNNYRIQALETSLGLSVLSSIAMLFIFMLIGSTMGLETFDVEPYGGMKNEPSADRWYITIFLGKTLFSSTLFALSFGSILSSDISVYCLITLEVAYILYLIFRRPYDSGLMNIGAIFCQLCTFYAFGLPITYRFYTPTEEMDVLLLFVLQGLLLLAALLTFARLLKSYYSSFLKLFLRRINEKDPK